MNVFLRKAIAEVTDPDEVRTRANELGFSNVEDGAAFCSSRELGITAESPIYCEYALSIPWIEIPKGTKVWIAPTIIRGDGADEERWVVMAFREAAGLKPDANDLLRILFDKFELRAKQDGKTELSADTELALITASLLIGSTGASQSLVLGQNLEAWAKRVDKNLADLNKFSTTAVPPGPAGGAVPPLPPLVGPAFPSDALSDNHKIDENGGAA